MNVYICDDFKGHWPVGVAAVVVASTKTIAVQILEQALDEAGLKQGIAESQLMQVNTDSPAAHIVCDGNY